MSTQALINLENISLQKQEKTILQNVNLQVQQGEIVSLIGPNGAGKTSLLRVMLGLEKSNTGSVKTAKKLSIGYMPQKLALNASLPITVKNFLQLAAKVSTKDMLQALAWAEAEYLLHQQMHKLSGGETQKVLLARCMLRQPDLLVLDEPAQGVDITGQEELYKEISLIRDRTQCGVLMVSHDLHLVMSATDRVVCLNRHVCCSGKPESVQTHPEYQMLFGDTTEAFAVYTHYHDHEHDACGEIVEK